MVRKNEGDYFRGEEGEIWYLTRDDGYTYTYKLKPHSIREQHWYESMGREKMTRIGMRNTLINVLEDYSQISLEKVKPYLLEEYEEWEINQYESYIEKEIKRLNKERAFELKVIKEYKERELSFLHNKDKTMRILAKKLGKKKSTKIYKILKKYFKEE